MVCKALIENEVATLTIRKEKAKHVREDCIAKRGSYQGQYQLGRGNIVPEAEELT